MVYFNSPKIISPALMKCNTEVTNIVSNSHRKSIHYMGKYRDLFDVFSNHVSLSSIHTHSVLYPVSTDRFANERDFSQSIGVNTSSKSKHFPEIPTSSQFEVLSSSIAINLRRRISGHNWLHPLL